MKKANLFVLLVAIGLTACVPQSQVLISTETRIVRDLYSPTAKKTNTPLPSYTPPPLGDTPRPTATYIETQEPTLVIPEATLSAEATLNVLLTKNPESGSYIRELSPYGQWAALFPSANSKDDSETILVLSLDGTAKWLVSYYEIYGYKEDDRLGGVRPIHWSKDGRYLYVAPSLDVDGPNLFFIDALSLSRLDLATGEIVNLDYSKFEFSPDDQFIVYGKDNLIRIRSLQSGHEREYKVPSKFERYGHFVWSPDSQKIVFAATYGEWYDGQIGFSILLIDLNNKALKVLIGDDLNYPYPTEWKEKDFINLEGLFVSKFWQFDLLNNQLIPLE
jgi:WD40 repeat protein